MTTASLRPSIEGEWSTQGPAGNEPGATRVEAAPELDVAWSLHADSVFARCMALMSGRRDHAEEAFSHTSFVAVQRYATHRDRIQNVYQWLLRVAHNVCMDLHRGYARQTRLFEPEPVESAAITAPHHSVDQEALLLRDEQIAILRTAVARLPPRLRAPLELRLRDELSDRRIATVLALPETAVRKRLQEARATLRPVLIAYRRGDSPALASQAMPLRRLVSGARNG